MNPPSTQGHARYPSTGGFYWIPAGTYASAGEVPERFPCRCDATCSAACDGECGCPACRERSLVDNHFGARYPTQP